MNLKQKLVLFKLFQWNEILERKNNYILWPERSFAPAMMVQKLKIATQVFLKGNTDVTFSMSLNTIKMFHFVAHVTPHTEQVSEQRTSGT